MSNNKEFYSRIVHKHDIESNWIDKASSFIPMKGEIIIYDKDENYDYERIKIGDGETVVGELPFISDELDFVDIDLDEAIDATPNGINADTLGGYPPEYFLANGGGSGSSVNADWNQNDAANPSYVKNRTHWVEEGEIILSETQISQVDEFMPIFEPFELIEGETYTVIYNGKSYKSVAKFMSNNIVGGIALGNSQPFNGVDTGEPFTLGRVSDEYISQFGCYGLVLSLEGLSEATVFIIKDEKIHHLNSKYIKDMYYSEIKKENLIEVLPEITLEVEGEGTSIYTPFSLTPGKTYEVNYNGTKYMCTAIDGAEFGEAGFIVLGNIDVLLEIGDNGIPFVLVNIPEGMSGAYALMLLLEAAATITLSINEISETIHKVPNKYLDLDWIPKRSIQNTSIVNETTITITGTYEDLTGVELGIIEGKEYTVTWNGEEYHCIANKTQITYGQTGVHAEYIWIGNGTLNNVIVSMNPDVQNTGEPFLFIEGLMNDVFAGAMVYKDYDIEKAVTYSIYGPQYVYNNMPYRYLPEDYKIDDISTASSNELLEAKLRLDGHHRVKIGEEGYALSIVPVDPVTLVTYSEKGRYYAYDASAKAKGIVSNGVLEIPRMKPSGKAGDVLTYVDYCTGGAVFEAKPLPTPDSELNANSNNPVSNSAVTNEFNNIISTYATKAWVEELIGGIENGSY